MKALLALSFFISLSAMAEEPTRMPADAYRPKSLTDQESGKDTRDQLPTLVAPVEGSSERAWDFAVIYKGEISNVMSGGLQRQTSYLENLDVRLNIDLEKLMSLKGGSLFLYGLGNRGASDTNSPTANVGDIQGTSNIETSSSQFILYEAWYQQMFFEEKVSLLLGLHDLNSEFYALDSSALFFNASFGVGKELSQTGENGPSIFPVASVSARLKVEPSERFYLQTAVFNAQSGDPNDSQATHIRAFGNDGTLIISEAGILNVLGQTSKFSIGQWSYDRTFDSLKDPAVQVTSQGFYGMAEVEVVKDFAAFIKYGRSSTESNPVGACVVGGFQMQHLFSEAWHDRLGLGFATSYFGSEYMDLQKTAGVDMAESETALELSYRFELMKGLALQPDYQYIITPSGDRNIDNAQVGSLRIEISL